MTATPNQVHIDRLPKNTEGPNPTKTTEQNYCGIKYGNEKGSISMGQIHEKGDVTSGVILQTPDAEHNLTLDISGPRKGHTILTSPGNVAVKCGMTNTEEVDTMSITADNGNICITATKGKIRMKCQDFELVTLGKGTDSGNIVFNASETFQVDSKKCLITTQAYTKICGSGTVEITANSVLNIYGSLFKAVTDSIAGVKNSKFGWQKKLREQLQTVTPTTDPYDLP